MLFKNFSIIDENFNVRDNVCVGTKGKIIDYISPLPPDENYGEVYDGRDRIMIPGFINCHTHLAMSGMRGYGENLSLDDWLHKKIFPYEDCLNSENIYAFTMLSLAECLKFGITSVSDMYFFTDSVAKAVIDSGINANISRSIISFGNEDLTESDRFKEALNAFRNYNGYDGGRLKIDFSLHGEYTNTDKVIRQFIERVKDYDSITHIHLAETIKEVKECKERHKGLSPVEYFENLGLFNMPVLAAHCVHLSENDMDILKKHNVSVATNPVSNLKLAGGIADIGRLYKKGINITLGTDSVASNNNLNFLEEIKLFAILHKGTNYDPALISPRYALQCATANGAIAQKRQNSGVLKVGSNADFIIMDTSSVNMQPVHDVISNIVYSSVSSDIKMTVINGRILYNNGEYTTIDIEKIKYDVNKFNKEILNKIKK